MDSMNCVDPCSCAKERMSLAARLLGFALIFVAQELTVSCPVGKLPDACPSWSATGPAPVASLGQERSQTIVERKFVSSPVRPRPPDASRARKASPHQFLAGCGTSRAGLRKEGLDHGPTAATSESVDLGTWSSNTGVHSSTHGSSSYRNLYPHGLDYGRDGTLRRSRRDRQRPRPCTSSTSGCRSDPFRSCSLTGARPPDPAARAVEETPLTVLAMEAR